MLPIPQLVPPLTNEAGVEHRQNLTLGITPTSLLTLQPQSLATARSTSGAIQFHVTTAMDFAVAEGRIPTRRDANGCYGENVTLNVFPYGVDRRVVIIVIALAVPQPSSSGGRT